MEPYVGWNSFERSFHDGIKKRHSELTYGLRCLDSGGSIEGVRRQIPRVFSILFPLPRTMTRGFHFFAFFSLTEA